MSNPTISVVMPSMNQGRYIEEAILSILNQDYANKELIVIDGGSQDETVKILMKYKNQLHFWDSKPDSGQSNALNIGFAHATGEYLTWCNSDDILLPGALSQVSQYILNAGARKPRWLVGGSIWMSPAGLIDSCHLPRKWSAATARRGVVNVYAPSSIFERSLLKQVGGINETLHFMMDTELWLRFSSVESYAKIDNYLWGLRLHPGAKMSGHHFAESAYSDSSHQSWNEKKTERELINNIHSINSKQRQAGLLIHKLKSITSALYWKGYVDTVNYKGRPWQCLFPELNTPIMME